MPRRASTKVSHAKQQQICEWLKEQQKQQVRMRGDLDREVRKMLKVLDSRSASLKALQESIMSGARMIDVQPSANEKKDKPQPTRNASGGGSKQSRQGKKRK